MIGSSNNECCWFMQTGNIETRESINFLKAISMKSKEFVNIVMKYLVDIYSKSSGIAEFDEFLVLSFMEHNIPFIVE